jgi:hypothetical protein
LKGKKKKTKKKTTKTKTTTITLTIYQSVDTVHKRSSVNEHTPTLLPPPTTPTPTPTRKHDGCSCYYGHVKESENVEDGRVALKCQWIITHS